MLLLQYEKVKAGSRILSISCNLIIIASQTFFSFNDNDSITFVWYLTSSEVTSKARTKENILYDIIKVPRK